MCASSFSIKQIGSFIINWLQFAEFLHDKNQKILFRKAGEGGRE